MYKYDKKNYKSITKEKFQLDYFVDNWRQTNNYLELF